MFLKTCFRVGACALLLGARVALAQLQLQAAPEYQVAPDVAFTTSIQVGADVWSLHTSADRDTTANMNSLSRLQLANSYPQWDYQSQSPWLRFEGGMRVGRDTLLTLRYRADQSTGSLLDEASVDWAWNAFGVRAGVVDPKISWCRTYDVDAPWVRENNPFCTIQPLNFAKSSAPGVQAYANFIAGGYSVQTVVGLYHPLWLDYAPNESPTLGLSDPWAATGHTKTGLAVSATHLRNGTEFRLGLLTDRYSASRPQQKTLPVTDWDLNANVVFAGANWYATPVWALRGTYFVFDGQADRSYLGRGRTLHEDRVYTSTTFELNYQASARDVFAFSRSRYDFVNDSQRFDPSVSVTTPTQFIPGNPHFTTTNTSVSWRRDWGKGVFTVLQLSDAHTDQTDSSPATAMSSNGQAVGLRLGYRFF